MKNRGDFCEIGAAHEKTEHQLAAAVPAGQGDFGGGAGSRATSSMGGEQQGLLGGAAVAWSWRAAARTKNGVGFAKQGAVAAAALAGAGAHGGASSNSLRWWQQQLGEAAASNQGGRRWRFGAAATGARWCWWRSRNQGRKKGRG